MQAGRGKIIVCILLILLAAFSCQKADFNGKNDPLNVTSETNKLYYFFLLTDPQDVPDKTFPLDSGLPAKWSGNWVQADSGRNCHSGSCLTSSNREHESYSYFETVRDVDGGVVTFYRYVNSEKHYDLCQFSVDGYVAALDLWGESGTDMNGPVLHSFHVYPGNHSFRWSYYKDSSFSMGEDGCWIDHISFP